MARAPNFTAGVAEILSATREAEERDWEIEKSITSGRSWVRAALGLGDGGEPNVCGWLRDKFGMPWQIVPGQIWDWLNGDDPRHGPARYQQGLQMAKLDLAELDARRLRKIDAIACSDEVDGNSRSWRDDSWWRIHQSEKRQTNQENRNAGKSLKHKANKNSFLLSSFKNVPFLLPMTLVAADAFL